MLNKEFALKINLVVLALVGAMDLIRGFMHTYQVKYAAVNLAGIEPLSDSLVLMGAFGISNFLTGFIYFLIIWKAPKLAPYILLLIPISYFIGGLGFQGYQGVQMESAFRGQYMMSKYLLACLVSALLYFLSRPKKTKAKTYEPKIEENMLVE
ncbi:MAG: hypothetical protein AAFU64_13515 [Bacteroidota bacterium]